MSKNIHVTLQIEIPVKDDWEDGCSLSDIKEGAVLVAFEKLQACIQSTDMRIDTDRKNTLIIVC